MDSEKTGGDPESEPCARCGQPARGVAYIGNERFCHESPYPTCYMLTQWDRMAEPHVLRLRL